MESRYQQLEQRAWSVLEKNNRRDHTVPSGGMYGGDQKAWLWDSAFHARGWRHQHPLRAAAELKYIFDGQWENGMLPHMRFGKFSLDRLLWSSHFLNHNAPKHIATSGITQPPVMAEAVQLVSEKLSNDHRQAFIEDAFPRLVQYHEWMYRERNPNGNGLFTSVHPWETGMDNTPSWMVHMRALRWGKTGDTVRHLYKHIAHSLRPDIRYAPASERASAGEGILISQATISLVKSRYDHKRMAEKHPLHIEDVHMNSVLIRNNTILEELSDEYNLSLPDSLRCDMADTQNNLEQLWNEDDQLYYPRNAVNGQPILIPTVASIMPLHVGTLAPERTNTLVNHLRPGGLFHAPYPIPAVPVASSYYHPDNYWHSTWANMNGLIADGLDRAGYHAEASELEQSTVEVAADNGFFESFSPEVGRGLGEKDFSWTAAWVIDILRRQRTRDPDPMTS